MTPGPSRRRFRATLINELLLGLSVFSHAVHLILGFRPLLILAAVGVILPVSCGLFMVAFFSLIVEPWPHGSGPFLNTVGYLCLLMSLVTFPFWGPLSFVLQRRAYFLTFAALGGPTAPQLRESSFELGMAWLTGLLARLYLAFFSTGLMLLLVSASFALMRLFNLQATRIHFFDAWRTAQFFASFALAVALTYVIPLHLEKRGQVRATLRSVWRHMPRFMGYQTGLVLLAALAPLSFFLPTVAAVAGALFHLDGTEPE